MEPREGDGEHHVKGIYPAALSLGELGAAMLFGTRALVRLPALLYEGSASIGMRETEGIAAVLAPLVFLLFLAAHRLGRGDARRA